MVQVRNGVFETNSSSTHSICISKKPVQIPKDYTIHFNLGEYGWEHECRGDTANYLYTAICEDPHLIEKLKQMLDKMGVKYKFEKPKKDSWGLVKGYVDHSEGLVDFLTAVLSDEDLLARYLFGGDSCIYTGNDNDDAEYDRCYVAREDMYTYDENGKWIQVANPYHDAENFDYFFKGN